MFFLVAICVYMFVFMPGGKMPPEMDDTINAGSHSGVRRDVAVERAKPEGKKAVEEMSTAKSSERKSQPKMRGLTIRNGK